MPKPTRPLIGAAAALAAVGVLGMSLPAAAQEFTLRWGHYLPDSEYVQVEKDFATAVEERTDGRVEIDIAFTGGLGQGNEVMTLAGRGAIDMASVVPGYYPDQLLFWRAYQIPFVFDSPKQAMRISRESYQALPVFKEELDRHGVRFLFHQPLGSYYMTGPDPNCTSIEDLAGKKIRTFGADIPKIFEAIDAVPVTVGVSEVYEALQRGTLDYSFLNRGNILSNRLYEVGEYSCGPVMSITGHLIVIGQRTWDKLPEDIQQIISEEAAKANKRYIDVIDTLETEAGAEIEARGGVIKKFPEDELERWKEMAPDLLQQWVETMAERGLGEQAEEVAAFWRDEIGE